MKKVVINKNNIVSISEHIYNENQYLIRLANDTWILCEKQFSMKMQDFALQVGFNPKNFLDEYVMVDTLTYIKHNKNDLITLEMVDGDI